MKIFSPYFVILLALVMFLYFFTSMRLFCSKNITRSVDSWCHDLFLIQIIMPSLLYKMLTIPQFLENLGVSDYPTAFRWCTLTDGINFTFFSPFALTCNLIVTHEFIEGAYIFTYTPHNISFIEAQPVILYFHGGGGVLSSAANFDLACRYMANEIGMKVIQVDYEKSPEVVFPYPQEQAMRILLHIMKGSIRNINPRYVIVAGDSFGGHIAAYLSIHWRKRAYDREYYPIFFQVLLYPLLQFVNLNLDSHRMFRNQEAFLKTDVLTHMLSLHLAGDLSLTEQLKSNCLIQYHPDIDSLINYYPNLFNNINICFFNSCSLIYSHSYYVHFANIIGDSSLTLLLNNDFNGLPPTFLVIPEYDILRDEALMFGDSLTRSGISVEKYIAKGMFHGFMVLLNEYKLYNGGVKAYQEMGKAIKRQLLRSF